MPHDGQDMTLSRNDVAVIDGLLDLTGEAAECVAQTLGAATAALRAELTEDTADGGRLSVARLDLEQHRAHGLAWLATYSQALTQMQHWAQALAGDSRFGEIEQLIHQIAFGEYLNQIAGGIPMSQTEMLRLPELGQEMPASPDWQFEIE